MGTEKGVKLDDGKLRFDLIPESAIEGLAEVLTMGARKYTPNGWKTVPDAVNRYYSALFRHLMAWRKGEKIDPESGLSHLKHVMINVAFLLELDETKVRTMAKADTYPIDLASNAVCPTVDRLSFGECAGCGRRVHSGLCGPNGPDMGLGKCRRTQPST